MKKNTISWGAAALLISIMAFALSLANLFSIVRTRLEKLPCSSEVNPACEVYVPQE